MRGKCELDDLERGYLVGMVSERLTSLREESRDVLGAEPDEKSKADNGTLKKAMARLCSKTLALKAMVSPDGTGKRDCFSTAGENALLI